VYGSLPTESQLAEWNFAISQHSAVPQGVLVSFFCYIYNNPQSQRFCGCKILSAKS